MVNLEWISLGVGVLRDFNKLKAESQSKNVLAWTPVVAEILDGYCRFDRQDVMCFYSFAISQVEIFLVFTVYVCGLPACHRTTIERHSYRDPLTSQSILRAGRVYQTYRRYRIIML